MRPHSLYTVILSANPKKWNENHLGFFFLHQNEWNADQRLMSHLVHKFQNHGIAFQKRPIILSPTAGPLCYKYWCPQAKKILCLQRKTLDPSWERISGLNEVCTLASFDTWLKFLLAGTKLLCLWADFEANVWVRGVSWSPSLALSDQCRFLSKWWVCRGMYFFIQSLSEVCWVSTVHIT